MPTGGPIYKFCARCGLEFADWGPDYVCAGCLGKAPEEVSPANSAARRDQYERVVEDLVVARTLLEGYRERHPEDNRPSIGVSR